jgi:quinol monooxygenase YgiN
MIFVIATSELKEGFRNEFIEIVKNNIPKVHAEAGCISYTLTGDFESGFDAQVKTGENVVTFVECWESIDHLKAHLAAPHMQEFKEKVKDMRISSSLKILTPVC